MLEAPIRSQGVEGPGPDIYGPAVTPDNGGAEDVAGGVETDQSVHLIGDPDRPDCGEVHRTAGTGLDGGCTRTLPPLVWILFSPARPGGEDGKFVCRVLGRAQAFARLRVQ